MGKAENIGALAFHFTAGVAAGALLIRSQAGLYLLSEGLFLLLASLLLIILRTDRAELLFPAFLLCGTVCALTDSLAGNTGVLVQRAAGAGERLRAFIDSIPFPSESTASLLKAFLTGDRSSLSRDTVQLFRASGASHLLALSGLHMGILYLLLSKLLWPLGNSPAARRFRYGLILAAAGFFTCMTGASPSIVRAFLFIALNETARLLGRPRPLLRILSAALLIQLVLTPSAIRSTGFQLSYLAMAGISLLYPVLERWYPEGPGPDPMRKVWQAAALSISCQAFTGPLAWFRFHSFPTFFLLTNLLAMPLTTLLMGTSVATLLLEGTVGSPAVLVTATDRLAGLLLRVLEIIASM